MREVMRLGICASILFAAGAAWGGPYTEEDEDEELSSAEQSNRGEKKKANRLEMGGRVFVRSTVAHVDVESLSDSPWFVEHEVSSARIVADYRRGRRLKVMVEADFGSGDAELKDGYVRVRPVRELTIKAGRFKRPMSAISLESAWRLPAVERGILNDLEPGAELPFGGRGDGLTVACELRNVPGEPEITLGVFEPEMASPIDFSAHFGLDPYLRVEAEPLSGLFAGASAAVATHLGVKNDLDSIRHAPVAGLDLALRRGIIEAWFEGFLGGSTVYASDGRTRGTMWAARTLVGLRIERIVPWLRRAGPYVKASIFDPNTEAGNDRAFQAGGGLNLRFTKFLRLQLEVESTLVDDVAILLQQDRLAFYAQLGAAF